MGCVHGKYCRPYRPCCCHYQPSSNGDPADTAGDDLGRCRVHEASQIAADSQSGYAAVASHNLSLHYAALTQRGHYPDSPDRANQDSFCIKPQFQGKPDLHFFGVFDGHGQFGTECANFTCGRLPEVLASDARLIDDPVKALHSAFVATNSQLHESEVDDTMSGTTAVTVLVSGDSLYIANAGDSRAVAGVWNGDCVAAVELSTDQTPFRTDEYERVKACGARVLSVDQVEGVKDPGVQSWGDEENDDGDPPRLWVQNGMYPGTAFTRSVGDLTAEAIGVIADPEVMTVKITPSHRFFVIASDGVFEFLSSQVVVDMVARFADPREGCSAIAAESYKLWLEHENRTDDITIIIVLIKSLPNSGSGATGEAEACHPKRGNLPDLLSYPSGFPTEKSPASIAPSPTPSLLKDQEVDQKLCECFFMLVFCCTICLLGTSRSEFCEVECGYSVKSRLIFFWGCCM